MELQFHHLGCKVSKKRDIHKEKGSFFVKSIFSCKHFVYVGKNVYLCDGKWWG